MADLQDIAQVKPELELTISRGSVRCKGILNTGTRRHLLEAVEYALEDRPVGLTIDISDLLVADVDGANALANIQRVIRDADTALSWKGLDAEHLWGIIPFHTGLRLPGGDIRVPARTSHPLPAPLKVC